MRVELLGPLRVVVDQQVVDLGGPRNRALVARLALEPGRPVSAAQLITDLWGDDLPGDPANALQSVVSRTRRRLPAGMLLSGPAGYQLNSGVEVDLTRFRQLAASGDRAAALSMWDGSALADLLDFPFARRWSLTLADVRLAVTPVRSCSLNVRACPSRRTASTSVSITA